VIAHTLPEGNPSTRVLERAGFAYEAEAGEGESRAWRWRRERGAAPS
jgi:RimJ/RimL family protein N-acetyltransferase